ncbi:MAG: hypothetical protein OXF74_01190 [Rhodobacteraceae bacterium]|nr:hypothetical protein [Paracoccaceae bacterium]
MQEYNPKQIDYFAARQRASELQAEAVQALVKAAAAKIHKAVLKLISACKSMRWTRTISTRV